MSNSFVPEIAASKVAGLIGLNKFQEVDAVMYDLVCKDKGWKAKIRDIETQHNRISYQSIVATTLRDPILQTCVKQGIEAMQTCEDGEEVLDRVNEQASVVLALRYADKYDAATRERLVKEVEGEVSKKRGLKNEKEVLDQYEQTRNVQVVERNAKMYKKKYPTFVLLGMIDGYVAKQNRVVDSKERMVEWPSVPLYDEIQMRVYMELTGAKEAELIERFPSGRVRTTVYTRKEEQWKPIEVAITSAVARLQTILASPEALKRMVFQRTVPVLQDKVEDEAEVEIPTTA